MGESVSTTVAEIKRRHPFPWTEQRIAHPGGVLFQLVDANGYEVSMLEMLALCRITTLTIANRDAQSQVSEQNA